MDKTQVLSMFSRYDSEKDAEKKSKIFRRTCRSIADQLGVPYVNRGGAYVFPTFTISRNEVGHVVYTAGDNDLADIDTTPKPRTKPDGSSTPRKPRSKTTDVNIDTWTNQLKAGLIAAGYNFLEDPGYSNYYWALQLHMLSQVYDPSHAVEVIRSSAQTRGITEKDFAIDRGLLLMGPTAKATR